MPYKFAPGGDPNTFIFPTDKGWFYILSFINRAAIFNGNVILENGQLVFEIAFDRSQLLEPKKGIDPEVRPTLTMIIQRQFDAQGELPVYYFICDMDDGKHQGRIHLFTQWFESLATKGWDLYNFELEDPKENGQTYYIGLFVHADHPRCVEFPDAFAQFLETDISSDKLIRRRESASSSAIS